MKKAPLLLIGLLTIIFISCKKENSGSNTQLDGTYTFKGMYAKTVSEATAAGTGEKTITTAEYNTTDNSGIVVFNNGKMTSKDLVYSISTELQYEYYVNGNLEDEFTFPFEFTLPATSSEGTYKIIGQDSIYFVSSTIFSGVNPSGGGQSGPQGGRFTINGNQLEMKMYSTNQITREESGYTIHENQSVIGTVFFEKQ